jgi:hypothetical protein
MSPEVLLDGSQPEGCEAQAKPCCAPAMPRWRRQRRPNTRDPGEHGRPGKHARGRRASMAAERTRRVLRRRCRRHAGRGSPLRRPVGRGRDCASNAIWRCRGPPWCSPSVIARALRTRRSGGRPGGQRRRSAESLLSPHERARGAGQAARRAREAGGPTPWRGASTNPV